MSLQSFEADGIVKRPVEAVRGDSIDAFRLYGINLNILPGISSSGDRYTSLFGEVILSMESNSSSEDQELKVRLILSQDELEGLKARLANPSSDSIEALAKTLSEQSDLEVQAKNLRW